ncbi:hypothetical protein C0992_005373 [Termitomyces sp. T32_za158]|nr:hypothetical protein C0992_005373 [Termitomyces sp. T32_za158]
MASFCLICARRYSRLLQAVKKCGKSRFEDTGEDRDDDEEDEIDGKESREEFDDEYMLEEGNEGYDQEELHKPQAPQIANDDCGD